MWDEAINAVKENDISWITENHINFRKFFSSENVLETGKLNDGALQRHYDHGLFKMFIAKSLYGQELDLSTGAMWIENATRLDGNWGWLLAIGVGGAYFTHYLDEPVRKKYFKPKDCLVSGSGRPDGKAEKYDDGWILSGNWDFCSGSEQASLFTAVTFKEGKITAFAIPKQKVEINRNWDSIGLNLTCSHSIEIDNALLPGDHFFDLSKKPEPDAYPLSSYPFDLFARVCFVPVILGLTKTILEEAKRIRDRKKKNWIQFQPEKYQSIQNLISDIESRVEEESDAFYEIVSKSWENHKRNRDVYAGTFQKMTINGSKVLYESISSLIPVLGMEVVAIEHPIQLAWRDLQTAYQHMIFRDF